MPNTPGYDISLVETNEVKRANKIYIKIPVVHGDVGPNISISECKFQSHQESRDEIHITMPKMPTYFFSVFIGK